MKIINITGLNSSGSTAVRDFLSEFTEYEIFPSEFWLFRTKDGIFDLYKELINYCSSNIERELSVRKFIRTMELLKNRHYNLTKLGFTIGNYLPDDFVHSVEEYISNLTIYQYYGYSDHLELYKDSIKYYIHRLLRFITSGVKLLGFNVSTFKLQEKIGVYSNDHDSFSKYTQKFIDSIFQDSSKDKLLLVATPPCLEDIELLIKLFPNSKTIVMLRDPRDVFSTAIHKNQSWFTGNENNKFNNRLQNFISNYSNYLNSINDLIYNEQVMVIYFEDLVLNYDEKTDLLINFLGLYKNANSKKFSSFNPHESIRTIGIYKTTLNVEEILGIEKFLLKGSPILKRYL